MGIKKSVLVIGCCEGQVTLQVYPPFMYEKIHGADIKIIGVKPFSCPTLTKAPFIYDHGDVAKMTPLLPMYSLGHSFIPCSYSMPAGCGNITECAPLVSAALKDGLMEAEGCSPERMFRSRIAFCKN